MVTDMIQFGIAMTGSFAAAYYALQQPQVGGLDGLMRQISPQTLRLLPDPSDWATFLTVLVIPLTVQWWSVWYPGAEPGGGSYVAQRMLASKSEKDAVCGHPALQCRALRAAALAVDYRRTGLDAGLSQLDDIARALPHVDPSLIGHDMAYPAMLRFLPPGLIGLMVAGLLAAYVSTISTHLNWGTSYVVHDLYRRFLKPGETEKHYVLVGRLVTAALMVVAGLLTFVLQTAQTASTCCSRWVRARDCSICCAGSGGASTRGARSRRWPVPSSSRWASSSPAGRAWRFPRTCRCSSASPSPPWSGWR